MIRRKRCSAWRRSGSGPAAGPSAPKKAPRAGRSGARRGGLCTRSAHRGQSLAGGRAPRCGQDLQPDEHHGAVGLCAAISLGRRPPARGGTSSASEHARSDDPAARAHTERSIEKSNLSPWGECRQSFRSGVLASSAPVGHAGTRTVRRRKPSHRAAFWVPRGRDRLLTSNTEWHDGSILDSQDSVVRHENMLQADGYNLRCGSSSLDVIENAK